MARHVSNSGCKQWLGMSVTVDVSNSGCKQWLGMSVIVDVNSVALPVIWHATTDTIWNLLCVTVAVLCCRGLMAKDPRVPLLSFTGSNAVRGRQLFLLILSQNKHKQTSAFWEAAMSDIYLILL